MDQELMLQASLIQKQSEELEHHLSLMQKQIAELETLRNNIQHLKDTNKTELISSMGKGVHLKSELKSKDLYVEVGSGIVVKKNPEETLLVIDTQLKRLIELKIQLNGQLDIYHQTLNKIIQDMQASRNEK